MELWGSEAGGGALYVKCMHVYRNVLVRETERERERRGLLRELKE